MSRHRPMPPRSPGWRPLPPHRSCTTDPRTISSAGCLIVVTTIQHIHVEGADSGNSRGPHLADATTANPLLNSDHQTCGKLGSAVTKSRLDRRGVGARLLACPPTLISADHCVGPCRRTLAVAAASALGCAVRPRTAFGDMSVRVDVPAASTTRTSAVGLAARTPMDRVVGLPSASRYGVRTPYPFRRTGVTRPRGGCCDHRLVSGQTDGSPKIDLTVPADVRGEFASQLGVVCWWARSSPSAVWCYRRHRLTCRRVAPMSVTFSPTSGSSSKAGRSGSSPGFYDAELERTAATPLAVLLIPGLLLLWYSLIPLLNRGIDFCRRRRRVRIKAGDGWRSSHRSSPRCEIADGNHHHIRRRTTDRKSFSHNNASTWSRTAHGCPASSAPPSSPTISERVDLASTNRAAGFDAYPA